MRSLFNSELVSQYFSELVIEKLDILLVFYYNGNYVGQIL